MKTSFLAVLLVGVVAVGARAEIKPAPWFTDHAVLQREMGIPVWGSGDEGEQVTVKFLDQEVTAITSNGVWRAWLKAVKAGGPHTMTFTGSNSITISNVLVGEVWLCSGQSNMAWPLHKSDNGSNEMAAATDPQLRLFTVKMNAADKPTNSLGGAWKECSPATAGNFSAVAYYFGRDLRKALNVPVGLINSSVGGTPAEAWMQSKVLNDDPELRAVLNHHAKQITNYPAEKAKYAVALSNHLAAVELAKQEGRPAPRAPKEPEDPATSRRRPTGLFNGMIWPLRPYAFRGVIWYQGESNNGNAALYQKLFPALIRNWRELWGGKREFPFLFVQIAPNKNMRPEIREAQLLTLAQVTNTAMVVTTDVGDANDIHPTNKEPVGARLALAARALAYREKIEYSGPLFESLEIAGDNAIVRFRHTGSGLEARGGALRGFEISANSNFVPATATIAGDKVIVSNPQVTAPVAVRYGWANVPDVNLFNKEGLPASPFRTEAKPPGT